MRDQAHADHFFRELRGFVGIFGQLYAAALPPPARVNLRFDHHPPAHLLGGLAGIVGMVDDNAAWNGHAVSAQNIFCLILVDLHRARRFITAAAMLLAPPTAMTHPPAGTWVAPVAWPFSATVPIAGRSEITITDRAAIGFVIDHSRSSA
jgi:hypothetical protein